MSPATEEARDQPPPHRTARQWLGDLIIWFGSKIVRFGQWVHGTVAVVPTETQELLSQTTDSPTKSHLDLYAVCRNKVKNENELTNHRLSWNFAIQGFLFTAYALCLQTIGNVRVGLANPNLQQPARSSLEVGLQSLKTSVEWLAGAGAIVSFFILLGAVGAQVAVWSVVEKLHHHYPEYRKREDKRNTHGNHLPGILGGGNVVAHLLGMVSPLLIPVAFIVVWLVLLNNIARS